MALRFPRINRIRWDKPANEAATLDDMQVFLGGHLMSLSAIHRKIVELEAEMAKAAAAEDFETAARLRNEITELRGQDPDRAARR